jgi:hypothetical protein
LILEEQLKPGPGTALCRHHRDDDESQFAAGFIGTGLTTIHLMFALES